MTLDAKKPSGLVSAFSYINVNPDFMKMLLAVICLTVTG